MSEIYLLGLAAEQRDWLSTRQAAIAMNVANAATPGYRSADVPSFDAVMKQSPVSMAATNQNHISSAWRPFAEYVVFKTGFMGSITFWKLRLS